jgi:hypothetical protein
VVDSVAVLVLVVDEEVEVVEDAVVVAAEDVERKTKRSGFQ